MPLLNPNRLFPTENRTRDLARGLYQSIENLPIISPHGHCDPRWFAENQRFPNPAELFVVPDHYAFRMLVSRGVTMEDLSIPRNDGAEGIVDPKEVWRSLAKNFHLFRGTPTSMWLEHSFEQVFGIDVALSAETADFYYETIDKKLASPDFLPRALFERFNIEVLSTTESALDDLKWHKQISASGWDGRIVTTYRPDAVVDPEFEGFTQNVSALGDLTGENVSSWVGYLRAHRVRREFFKQHGATASDHGHLTANTADLSKVDAEKLYSKVVSGKASATEADLFRGQMLTEMARMSLDDGLTLQIHAGSRRNHHAGVLSVYGRDKGFDIPGRTDYVEALQPLLNTVGFEPGLKIILFTLDETTYSRELAPLAGAYPCLLLGPPWWFFDSYEGIKRFRETTTETCGFYNTAGFNDDTRAFCSIPARHDVARRSDCAYLANLVATGRLREDEAYQVAYDLTYKLAKDAYNL